MDRLGPELNDHHYLHNSAYMTLKSIDFGLTHTQLETLQQVFDEQLVPDRWLTDGEYRRRAYQCFHLNFGGYRFTPVQEPPPYVQARSVNPLFGGIERRFHSVPVNHPATRIATQIASVVVDFLVHASVLLPHAESQYVIDVHYIRITAPGKPAPEGIHRDGLIAGSVHLVQRTNVSGGTTAVFDPAGTPLCQVTLTEPLDSLIFDDSRVLHYTDDVSPIHPSMPAYRDAVLIGVRT